MKKLAFLLTLLGGVVLAFALYIIGRNESTGIALLLEQALALLDGWGVDKNAAASCADQLLQYLPSLKTSIQELLGPVPLNETTLNIIFFAVPNRMLLAVAGGAAMLLGNMCSLSVKGRR